MTTLLDPDCKQMVRDANAQVREADAVILRHSAESDRENATRLRKVAIAALRATEGDATHDAKLAAELVAMLVGANALLAGANALDYRADVSLRRARRLERGR